MPEPKLKRGNRDLTDTSHSVDPNEVVTVSAAIYKRENMRLQQIARDKGVAKSDVIRMAIQEFLERSLI